MPRQERKKSKTGIYHVMLRGINQQTIFEDEEDNQRFLQTLKDYQEKSGYIIYAYCLMGNHIHLLMKEGEEDIGLAFKRIGVSYVYWYNWKYERRGHLFQGRFKSEANTRGRFFCVLFFKNTGGRGYCANIPNPRKQESRNFFGSLGSFFKNIKQP